MAKGQAEILGIALVIVLVILGLLIVVMFMLGEEESDLEATVLRTEIGTNLVHSILKTHDTNCKDLRIEELLIDCADYANPASTGTGIDKDTSGSVNCAEELSCKYAESILRTIFRDTLDKWQRPYEFSVQSDRLTYMTITSKGCQGKDVDTAYYPIPTATTIITAELRLC
jgi:hypothetical protein